MRYNKGTAGYEHLKNPYYAHQWSSVLSGSSTSSVWVCKTKLCLGGAWNPRKKLGLGDEKIASGWGQMEDSSVTDKKVHAR